MNLNEEVQRIKSIMGVISEKLEDIQGTPLYHKTSTSRGLKIMDSDSLITSRPSDEYLKLDDELRNTEKQSAISFTRDKNWEPDQSIGVGSGSRLEDKHITFVVDRNKLKTKYKIEPFNYEIIGDRDYRNKGVELPKWMKRRKKNPEMEERVFTDRIYPLHKYLIDVIYTGDNPEIQEYLDGYKSQYLNKSDVTNDFEQLDKEEMKEGELTEKCWKGYTQKGIKTMFGKRYPNCVKKKK